MNYLVKNAQGDLLKLTVVSGLPQLPEGMELIGEESIINPNGFDLAVSTLTDVEVSPEYQVLVQEEVLAVDEVLAVLAAPEKWTKEGEDDLFVDPVDVSWTYVPAIVEVEYVAPVAHQDAIYNTVLAVMGMRMVADPTKAAIKNTTSLVATAYNVMNEEVLAQMALVFGTINPDSANANKQTWELMKLKPELFVPSKFATNAEVITYADNKIAGVEAYAVWRETRIDTFRIYKALLGA